MPTDKIIAVHKDTENGVSKETRVGPDAQTELNSLNIKVDRKEDFVKKVNRKLRK